VASGGRAGHGSSSPWDIHNTLIAAGPDLARGITVEMPSANVDFVPTFLMLLGIDVPSSAQGRVLREALVSAAAGRQAPALRISEHTERTRDGRYSVTGHMSTVRVGDREYRYLDATTVTRR
jgi:arylsulfatase A-like enzyme